MSEAQLSFLGRLARRQRPRKRVRAVSKQVYAELRDTDRLAKSTHTVLTALAAYFNRFQAWPTTRELVQWMFERGLVAAPAANLISGRLTFLVSGIDRRGKDGALVHQGGGVCEFLPARRCTVSGRAAHPIRVREAGSLPAPHGVGGQLETR